MELNFVHIFGPVLMIVTFLFWGKGMVNRERGREFRALPAVILLIIAIGYHVITPAPDYIPLCENKSFMGMFLDKITAFLMNFGIGMLIDSAYLGYHKHHPKIYWVPGVIALLLSAGVYLFANMLDKVIHSVRSANVSTELLLELGADDKISEVEPILHKYKAIYEKAFPEVSLDEDSDLAQYYLVSVDADYAEPLKQELLADKENIDLAEENGKISLNDPKSDLQPTNSTTTYKANDPYLKNQWFAEKLHYNKVYELLSAANPKRKAKVAILDTGIDSGHEDISSSYNESPANSDQHGHGTHCAALAGATTNNNIGVGSMNWDGKYVELLGFAALSSNGSGSNETIAQAIIDATDAKADVISLSLGGFSPWGAPKVMKDAVNYALKRGAIVVVAAGNDNGDAKNYSPANIEGVITVSAVDEQFRKATFSNTNASLKMPISSPGVNILSATPSNQYASWNGTSMATPIVAGLIGIMKSFDPNISSQTAYKILMETGVEGADSKKVGKTINPEAVLKGIIK